MATVALPPDLRNRIAAVAHRVRRLRFLRGLGLLCVILALGFGAALLADYFFDLPSAVRIGVLCAWGGLGLVVFFAGLVLPMMRRFDAAALAAVVEEKYPDLGERLTTSVELADGNDDFHGAPELIADLMRDTEARTRGLNFLPSVSSKSAGRAVGAAVAVLALVLCPAVVWPGQYADLVQRFFRPWVTPPAFAIDAAPAESFAARGRPLTLTAHLTPIRHAVRAPDVCTLVQIAADGKQTTTPMPADKEGGYSAIVTPGADFSYRVETGPDASPLYPVETVQPVDIAADYPEITAKPPAYAEDTVESQITDGLVDLTILQNGTVRFDCKFTRPAVAAFLDWTTPEKTEKDGAKVAAVTTTHAIPLAADRQTGSVTLPAVESGKYALRLVAEHGVETPFPAHDVIVKPDTAPEFKQVGKGGIAAPLRAVLPYDKVPLEFGVTDDVAVAKADVEYRVNRGAPTLNPVAMTGLKTSKADAKTAFSLTDVNARPGDLIEYRLRVTDNLPPEFGGPHVVYYPADHALTLRVATDKDINSLMGDIYARLDRIKENLKAEERGVYKTRNDSRDRGALTPAQADEVKELKKDNKDTENALQELAKVAEAAPSFQPLADLARDVADKEMKESGKALDNAAADHKTPAERESHFQNSEKQLDSALARLDQLRQLNEELARKAQAELELAKLADREKALADKAADLAAKDPVKDPSAKDEAEKIKQDQQKTADELQRLTEENPALRKDLDEARAEQAADLAQRARELAKEQRDLATAQADTEKRQNAERFAELAKKQQELADKASELAKDTKAPSQATNTDPLKPEDAQRAADALKQGDPTEALKHQDQEAHDLDRVADQLAKAIDLAKDPREAARQLARLEEAVKQKALEEITKQNDRQPLAERLKPLQAEQKAIARATERLSVPADKKDAQEDKKQAEEHTATAVEALKQQNWKWIADLTERAKQELNRLADKLPSLEQRKDQALREVAKLRQQQDEIAKKAEQAAEQAHNADPKDPKAKEQIAQQLTEAARKQADAAQELSKLDAPNQEARQEKAENALNNALKDLMDGRKQNLAASQQDAKRQLQRLEQALKGEKPVDEKAAELAQKQKDLAAVTAKEASDPKTTPEQKQALKQQQQQIAQEAKNLDAPEAPQRKAEASEAADKAAKAAEKDPTAAEAQKDMQQAAHKLDDLAKQLNGRESEAARAQRLAEKQAEASAEARHQAEKNPDAPPDAAAQAKEKQIADEAKQLHAGDEAQAEKQRATDALQKAQDAKPRDQAKAQREAADALHDLADKLAGRDNAADKANELAREQHDLAKETADPEAGKQNADDAKKAADQQAEIAHQQERLDAKGAADAHKDAAEKANAAAKALDKANDPAAAKDAVAKAAEAADKLAQELGKEQTAQRPDHPTESAKPTDSPRQAAEHLAQQQRQLAQQTQQAQDQKNQHPGEAGKQAAQKAMQQVAEKQKQLNEQASHLPADQAQKALEQAHEAMAQAEQALARNDGEQAKQKQNEAADALQRLGQQLPAKAPDTAAKDHPADADAPHGLPTKQQADQARDLAKQQRDLADQVRHAAEAAHAEAAAPKDNPVGDLAKQQAEVAKQAGEMAQEAAEHHGKDSPAAHEAGQAHQSAQQAAGKMQAGDLHQAREAGQQAAQQMHQLSKQLAQTPGDPQAPAEAAKAQQLAEKQEAINRQLDPLADNAAAQQAQQEARQQDLQKQTGELTQDLNKLAQQAEQGHNGQQAQQAHQAANSGQQAQNAQQQAQQQAHQGNEQGAQQSQQQAAQNLEQAAQQIAQAAGQHSAQEAGQPTAGQEVQQAQGAIQQAQGQMNQGQAQSAQASMQQAAQALAQAAQHAGEESQQKGKPGEKTGKISDQGMQAGGRPDASLFSPELKQYAGKTWGELPGELRTKIVQQAKVKYGDDYARMIKLYFEQAADTRNRK